MSKPVNPDDATFWDQFKMRYFTPFLSAGNEIQALIPDSILFGSLLLYFLTQNSAFGVFGIFIFEMIASHKLISWIFCQTAGVSRSNTKLECYSGYKTPRFDVQRMLTAIGYPSLSVFSISSIGTYLGLSMNSFSDTLKEMGPEWESRIIVSSVFIGLLISLIIALRLLSSCDTVGEVIIALLLGLFIGTLFFFINKAIFGKEGMNFLGLPYVVDKYKEGSPIYVCSTDTSKAE